MAMNFGTAFKQGQLTPGSFSKYKVFKEKLMKSLCSNKL